jgi:hypothetical protein
MTMASMLRGQKGRKLETSGFTTRLISGGVGESGTFEA